MCATRGLGCRPVEPRTPLFTPFRAKDAELEAKKWERQVTTAAMRITVTRFLVEIRLPAAPVMTGKPRCGTNFAASMEQPMLRFASERYPKGRATSLEPRHKFGRSLSVLHRSEPWTDVVERAVVIRMSQLRFLTDANKDLHV